MRLGEHYRCPHILSTSHLEKSCLARSPDRLRVVHRTCLIGGLLRPRGYYANMGILNLVDNAHYQFMICIEHGYCVPSAALQYHLNFRRGIKGERLQAALAEVTTWALNDPRQAQAPTNAPAIPHLIIDSGFRCGIPACKLSRPFVSKTKRAVEKHLSKEHGVSYAKSKTKPTPVDIEAVRMQLINC